LIADDHELVRKGIRAPLETRPDFTIVGEAGNGREATVKVIELRPHVTIMDISMPEMNGVETEVVALIMHSSETLARELLEAGARAFVLKSDAALELVSVVASLSQHLSFLTAPTSNIVIDEFRRGNSTQNDRQKLSAREAEVIQLLTEGKSNKDIARQLVLSVRTVETHRANIKGKLNLHSIGELFHHPIRNKIVSISTVQDRSKGTV
jgi:DNA-binding NarL/FixJ family response regulator